MKAWLKLSPEDKRTIFEQTSLRVGLPPSAVEKDWWVMIALRAIFASDYAPHFVFKGGTSLSKSWGIIERFSEDIDLAIDREFLGYDRALSRRDVTRLRKASCSFIHQTFQHHLGDVLEQQGITGFELGTVDFERSDTDPLAIELIYPALTERIDYLRPRVLIEISARSLREPFENRELISMVGTAYPDMPFADAPLSVPSVLPSRTLLEKIFLLHEEFQKPEKYKIRSARMTRHLYDIARIMDTEYLAAALTDREMYQTIVTHRRSLTQVTWVDYEKHAPEYINFVPPERIIAAYERDYRDMRESMFYGETESFAGLIRKLRGLNDQINAIGENPTPE